VRQFKTSIVVAIAVITGIIVLVGYFIELPVLKNLRIMLLHYAVIFIAVALIVGVVNLVQVHWKKFQNRQPGGVYSLILIISLLVTIIIVGYFGPTSTPSLWIFSNIQIPVASSLIAVLTVVLTYTGIRLLKRGLNLFSLLFMATVLIVILGTVSFQGFRIPGLSELRTWITQVPAVGGARGILLGVALGTIATGMRILMGSDRPYGR
jgi:hypothetical protein